MSPAIFGVAFAVGAGALALWTDTRFPQLLPEELRTILLHTLGAFLVLHVVGAIVGPLVAAGAFVALLTLLGVALPAVAYAFLVCVWAIRLFQGAQSGMR
jgi:hypothetical protein